jgi:hypothetical protein
MTQAITLPQLPPDAGEKVYVLATVRGELQWLPTCEGHYWVTGGQPQTRMSPRPTLWVVAPEA